MQMQRVQRMPMSPSQPLHRGGHVWGAARYRQSLWSHVTDQHDPTAGSHELEKENIPCSGSTECVREATGNLRKLDAPFTKNQSLLEGTLRQQGVHSNL